MPKITVVGSLDYISGYLRGGSFTLDIDENEWNELSEEEKKDKLINSGELVVTDFRVEDYGEISDYEIIK